MAKLGAQAAKHEAVAAIRVVRREGVPQIQLWVYDALTRKVLLSRTDAMGSTVEAEAVVSLRLVELLEPHRELFASPCPPDLADRQHDELAHRCATEHGGLGNPRAQQAVPEQVLHTPGNAEDWAGIQHS